MSELKIPDLTQRDWPMAATQFGTIQRWPAMPVALYSSTSGRCSCGDTVKRRTDDQWIHGHGFYCREKREASPGPAQEG